ncbi:MAG: YiiX/YebB-like N1pC/P60 family cysteine hydrolase, partial [Gemmatimonadales bacterium]
ALERARAGHTPYDFTMDYTDPSRLFCSEVASSVYRELGVTLWTGLSTISAPGLRRWLWSFGVRQFETQEPSDLEYDPALVVVAEWREPAALLADHIDNAVTDVMLERADSGEALAYDWWRLPVARVLRAYGWLSRRMGGEGPIPEGMSAEAALRTRTFVTRHRELAARVRGQAAAHAAERGYPPPYWTLVDLARDAASR